MDTLPVLGFELATLTEVQTKVAIQTAIDEAGPLKALQLNVANLYLARKDGVLASIYHRADLLSLDGRGIYWGARFLGIQFPEPIAGVRVMLELLQDGAKRQDRFFLLGSEGAVVREAERRAKAQYGDVIAGSHDGFYRTEKEQLSIIQEIRDSTANCVFVGMNSPKKEFWTDRWTSVVGIPVLGVGGSLEVLAGRRRLAPNWIRKAGMEWFFRLVQEPGRLSKRYATTNLWFAGLLLREAIRMHRIPPRKS